MTTPDPCDLDPRLLYLISSLSTHLTSYVSHEWFRPNSCPKEMTTPVRALTSVACKNHLISSLSAHLTSYDSHDRTRPRFCTEMHTSYLVGPRFEKYCIHESVNGLIKLQSFNYELGRGKVPAKFHHDPRRIAPRRAVAGLGGQTHYTVRLALVKRGMCPKNELGWHLSPK